MKNSAVFSRFLMLVSLTVGVANAAVIASFTDSLTAADPTQLGRLSRNGIAQDWAGDEGPFPGVLNPASVYHYQTYVFNVGITPYIQIDVDSLFATTFVSAYTSSYAPNPTALPNLGLDTNWLGDPGASGDPAPSDPRFFQVTAPINSNLVLVVNEVTPGAGLAQPYNITVEGFIDTEFDDPPSAPEPSTVLLGITGLAIVCVLRRFRPRTRASVRAC